LYREEKAREKEETFRSEASSDMSLSISNIQQTYKQGEKKKTDEEPT
jgi:hypothetical protein